MATAALLAPQCSRHVCKHQTSISAEARRRASSVYQRGQMPRRNCPVISVCITPGTDTFRVLGLKRLSWLLFLSHRDGSVSREALGSAPCTVTVGRQPLAPSLSTALPEYSLFLLSFFITDGSSSMVSTYFPAVEHLHNHCSELHI